MPSPLETDTRKGLSAHKSDRIAKIETFRVPPRWLFVRVETESGIVGWGEATLEGHSEAVEGAFEDFRERFIGWEASNIEDICSFFSPKHR
jgi:galactonate dehydratase